jgi:prophage regulatory protein
MQIIRLKEVMLRTGLSRSSIYSFCKQGTFPSSVKLGDRAVGWKENEINDWVSNRPRR